MLPQSSAFVRPGPMKWSTAYGERLKEVHSTIKQERENASLGFYRAIVGGRLITKMKERQKKYHPPPRKVANSYQNLQDLKRYTQAIEWEKHWGSSSICSICHNRAVSDVLFCRFCDNVAHRLCVQSRARKMKQAGVPQFTAPPVPKGMDMTDRFICTTCEESQKQDEDYYEKYFEKWRCDRLRDFYQRIIARKVMTNLQRKVYQRQRRCFILFQAAVRRSIARNEYLQWQRAQVRAVVIELRSLPTYVEMTEKFLIVLTVVDPIKHQQMFRLDKKADAALEEAFLLPGITGYMTVVISICRRREESATHCTIISQGLLFLRDIEKISQKRTFSITFSKSIMWLPQDLKKDNCPHVLLLGAAHSVTATMATNIATSQKISMLSSSTNSGGGGGSLNSINGWTGSGSNAGTLTSSSIFSSNTTTASSVNFSNRDSSYLLPSLPNTSRSSTLSPNVPGTPSTPGAEFVRLFSAPSALSQANHGSSLFADVETQECKLGYIPQNTISSMCVVLSGPPLDVLRRVTVDHTRYSNGRLRPARRVRGEVMQSRRRRWWVILMDLKLYFFEVYGDSLPRIITDISDTVCSLNKSDKAQDRKVSILYEDGTAWSLEFGSAKEASTFLFNVSETRAALNDGSSMYMKQEDVSVGRSRLYGDCHLFS